MKKQALRLLLMILLSFTLLAPAAGAVPPPAPNAKALFNVSETWFSPYYMNYQFGVNPRYQQLEFEAFGPNGANWLVSIDGTTFRLRDKNRVNPTIYTKQFTFFTTLHLEEQIAGLRTVFINSDGLFEDANSHEVSEGIKVNIGSRGSYYYYGYAEVYLSGWRT